MIQSAPVLLLIRGTSAIYYRFRAPTHSFLFYLRKASCIERSATLPFSKAAFTSTNPEKPPAAKMSQISEYTLQLQTSLKASGLVPGPAAELIPHDFTPTTALRVSYEGRAVECGNLFRANECKRAPTITFAPDVSLTVSCRTKMLSMETRSWTIPGVLSHYPSLLVPKHSDFCLLGG